MKISKIPVTRTGLFVILSFVLLTIILFVIGDKQKLFSSTIQYPVKFKEISGLKEGAQVQISGISVGSVSAINLPAKAGDSVLLTINIIKDAVGLIHTDTRAKVMTEGLVGSKAISLSVGGIDTKTLEPGSLILGISGSEIMSIVDSATSMVGSSKRLLDNLDTLIVSINSGKGTLGSLLTKEELYTELVKTIQNTNALMTSLSHTSLTANGAIKDIADESKKSVAALNSILDKIHNGNGTLAKILNDSSIYVDLDNNLKTLGSTMIQLNDIVSKFSKSAGNAEELTEALKHNFLVKGYFEDRGYWNASNYEATIQSKLDSLKMIERRINERLHK